MPFAFVTFASVRAAVAAAIRVNQLVAERNVKPVEEDPIEVAIGIGFGPILLADHDFFGDEVNLASKLGEDIAGHGEVLLTLAARSVLQGGEFKFRPLDMKISGVALRASRLVY